MRLWKPPSLFFFTFHKCASVFISRCALQRARGLTHIDHAARMFAGRSAAPTRFAPRGHLYGPLRLSAEDDVLDHLVMPALDAVRRDGVRACLMVRDPRDMLVSMFFHSRDGMALRPDLPGARKKEEERAEAVRLDVDGYVLNTAPRFLQGCERAVQLVSDVPSIHVLRYEDMVDRWSLFEEQLQAAFDLSPRWLRTIAEESRPNDVEQPGSHKRSGATGDHRRKLLPETVAELTRRFEPVLRRFGYIEP
jgi:Sulfotransferase domain